MLNTMSTILNIICYSFVAYNSHKVEMLLNHYYYYYPICLLSRVSEMVSDNNNNNNSNNDNILQTSNTSKSFQTLHKYILCRE